jgi:hypothetical protein
MRNSGRAAPVNYDKSQHPVFPAVITYSLNSLRLVLVTVQGPGLRSHLQLPGLSGAWFVSGLLTVGDKRLSCYDVGRRMVCSAVPSRQE